MNLMYESKRAKIGIGVMFLILLNISVPFAQSVPPGKISGKLVDAQTGEPLIGANVYLENTVLGAATDLDGVYLIPNVPEGEYLLVVSNVGYTETKVSGVKVTGTEVTRIDLAIHSEILTTETITVEARSLKNNDASLLRDRQKSNAISDAISAETISRQATSDAADAMRMVTGASVVDGKYVYVRGLGDRYSNTQLNGAELPSADPDKKAFNLDIVPTQLLDNIVTKKTFTPDESGNFSGGLVNIGTKSFPDQFFFQFSARMASNSQTTFNNNYLTYTGGGKDWLGYDDGTRAIPGPLSNPDFIIPTYGSARRNLELAKGLDASSKAFNQTWTPSAGAAPINQSYSVAVGDQISFLGIPAGYHGSVSYSRDAMFYENGTLARWQLSGTVQDQNGLYGYKNYSDNKSTENVLIGGLATFSIRPHANHEISTDYMYTQSGTKTSRYMNGVWPDQLSEGEFYETQSVLFQERNLSTFQLKGKHYIPSLADLTVEWNGSLGKTKQEEPDLRFFSNTYRPEVDTVYYSIDKNLYNNPTSFFRTLNEDKNNLKD